MIAAQEIKEPTSRASSPITTPSILIKMEEQQSQYFSSTPIKGKEPLREDRNAPMGAESSQSGLASSMPNHQAYLSGWSLDIIHHIYGNQWGTAILHQMVWDHTVAAGNRIPSPGQPDSDGEDKVVHHFWDKLQDGGEDPPWGGYPGRGGPPGRGPPRRGSSDGGSPDDDDDNDNKLEDDNDNEDDEGPLLWPGRPPARRQPTGPQPVDHLSCQNYLRDFTPGNNYYMGSMQQWYAQHIWEQVGQLTGPVGLEVKAMNLPKPGKHGGQDDVEKFNKWLSHLLKYYYTFKVIRPNCNKDWILYTRLYLEGLASQWYDQEVDSPDQQVQDWTFKDVICGLFQRFMHEASVQNAADQYDCTRFSHEKEALAFYNNMKCHACRMVQPLDNYLFRRKFLHGLPHSIIKSIFEACRISTEHSTIKEILEEVQHMETAQKAINIHMRSSHTGSGGKSFQGWGGSNPDEKKVLCESTDLHRGQWYLLWGRYSRRDTASSKQG